MESGRSVFTLPALLVLITGCSENADVGPPPVPVSETVQSQSTGHDHSSKGPNGGTVIDLAGGSYHAEVVPPAAEEVKQVEIYILDGSAAKNLPIEVAEVTMNLVVNGEPTQIQLTAAALDSETEGKASRFVSTNELLVGKFASGIVHGELVVEIDGKSCRGEIDYHADGSGH